MKRNRTRVVVTLLLASIVVGPLAIEARREEVASEAPSLGALAGAVSGLSLAVAGWWDAFARPEEPEERERLVELSTRLSRILALQRVDVLRAIDDYIRAPDEDGWGDIQRALGAVVVSLDDLLRDLEGEGSDFVLKRAYPELLVTVRTRRGLAKKLKNIPRPETPAELRELRQIQAEYVLLVGNLELAIAELNSFIEGAAE